MGMDIYGKNPSSEKGKYFRANIWSWRPIHALCKQALNRPLTGWGYNDGNGLKTADECRDLATKLETLLKTRPEKTFVLESNCRVDANGRFLEPGVTGGRSAYQTTRAHVREFIKFLRACGGFEIH